MKFEDFFREVYEHDPFPWQSRLAKQVSESGWPGVLDLPTGVGKTSALDIAVYHLIEQVAALQSGKLKQREAALRVLFVVDRRIVVDGAYQHAKHLAECLRTASSPCLTEARELLQSHFCLDENSEPINPLHVSLMRGGMYRDEGWSLSPAVPTICVSTVDQVGSRLLFRGYGVSPSMRPIHAGLIANDSLLFLDEAHLSNPFLETLKSVQLYMQPEFIAAGRNRSGESPGDSRRTAKSETDFPIVGRPLKFVQMSATVASQPADDAAPPFQLDELDRNHNVIRQRLSASKVTRIEKVTVNKDDSIEADNEFAAVVVARAVSLSTFAKVDDGRKKRKTKTENKEANKGNVIGIVVNRVRTARRIFELLAARADVRNPMKTHDLSAVDSTKGDVVLLTGRIRAADRDELLFRKPIRGKRGWLRWIKAGRDSEPDRPIFVVATQTVEVGADLDFDALITEAAPLDCLRQRFGRLDRRGERKLSAAFILGRSTDVAKSAKDRVYGDRLTQTWQWLEKNASGKGKDKTIDFGVDSMGKMIAGVKIEDLCAERATAPFLLPTYVNLWSRTNPAPVADPDVSLFLHGPQSRPADVQVVWRADLLGADEEQLQANSKTDYVNALTLLPPSSLEACSVPIYEVQRWLEVSREASGRRGVIGDVTDVEGDSSPGDTIGRGRKHSGKMVLRWKGEEKSQVQPAGAIRPGDTIVVPCSYGGHDAFGWNPASTVVSDIAECGSRWGRAKPVVRYHPALLARDQWNVGPLESEPEKVDNDDDDTDYVRDFLTELVKSESLPEAVRLSCKSLLNEKGRLRFKKYREADEPKHGWITTTRKRLSIEQVLGETNGLWEPDSDGMLPDASDRSSFGEDSLPISLNDHTEGVEHHAVRFGQIAGLPENLIDDLRIIARWHDVGKIDEPFQTLLHNGDAAAAAIALAMGDPLAKSGQGYRHPGARLRVRQQAGVPDGFRHETLSVVLLRETSLREALAEAHDPELVEFIIGTHHGDGRASHQVVLEQPVALSANWHGVEFSIGGEARTAAAIYRLDNDWEGLFVKINQRYGVWGVAWLETGFRLADHRQSEKEQRDAKRIAELSR